MEANGEVFSFTDLQHFQSYGYLALPEPDGSATYFPASGVGSDDPQEILGKAQTLADETGRIVHIYKHRKTMRPVAGD